MLGDKHLINMEVSHYSSSFLFHLSRMLSHLGQRIKAIKPYVQVLSITFCSWWIRLSPNSPQGYEFLGRLYAGRLQWQEAMICFQSALEKNHPRPFAVHNHLARTFLTLGRVEEAITASQLSIDLNPQFCRPYYFLGEALLEKGEHAKAALAFQKFNELNTDFSWSHHGLGLALFRQSQFQESIQPFRRAIELNPDFLWSYRLLGEALGNIGRHDDAIPIFQSSSRILISQTHPHFRWLQQSDKTQKPKFLIVGQVKCGTTSLYHYLTQHPKILPATEKEIDFWSEKFHYGIEWYLSHFPPVAESEGFITGEASTTYLNSRHAPERVFQFLTEVKLIVLLRNPIDRAYSAYHMKLRTGGEHRTWEETLDHELKRLKPFTKPETNTRFPTQNRNYLSRGIYDYSIKSWMKFFDKKQILILKSEYFYENTETVLNQVFDFFGRSTIPTTKI